MTKIGEIKPRYTNMICIYYDEASTNPYKVVEKWNERGEYGLKKRSRQIARYADLASCTALVHQMVMERNEESR